MQGFDTKWDEVFLSMTKVHDEDSLDNLLQEQLRYRGIATSLGLVDLQNTSRSKEMVRRHVEQKIRCNRFNVCHEDRSLFKAKQLGKGTEEDEQRPKTWRSARRFVQLQARCKTNNQEVNRRRSRSTSEPRRHSEGD